LMCAWPKATFFFSLRRTFLAPVPWRLFGGIGWKSPVAGSSLPGSGRSSATREQCSTDVRTYFLPTFFLPAIALRGPLRVRALVCVR
jgi:hypothetical protein